MVMLLGEDTGSIVWDADFWSKDAVGGASEGMFPLTERTLDNNIDAARAVSMVLGGDAVRHYKSVTDWVIANIFVETQLDIQACYEHLAHNPLEKLPTNTRILIDLLMYRTIISAAKNSKSTRLLYWSELGVQQQVH